MPTVMAEGHAVVFVLVSSLTIVPSNSMNRVTCFRIWLHVKLTA